MAGTPTAFLIRCYMERDYEAEEFHKACNKVLHEESFDKILRREMYNAYKEILSRGKSKVCHNCIYCDRTKGECMNTMVVEKKMIYCWKAKNKLILKKAGLYGQERNIKTGVD